MSPALIRGVLQRASALVTRRLHPCIFATQAGCPFVSLSAEVKTRGVLSMLGLEDHIFDFSAGDPAALHARVREAMVRREDFHNASLRAAQIGFDGRQRLLELLRSSMTGVRVHV
jgi:polysaccharide pyruvyl transferase WcaK-like protein